MNLKSGESDNLRAFPTLAVQGWGTRQGVATGWDLYFPTLAAQGWGTPLFFHSMLPTQVSEARPFGFAQGRLWGTRVFCAIALRMKGRANFVDVGAVGANGLMEFVAGHTELL
jgi:hypothetical protein